MNNTPRIPPKSEIREMEIRLGTPVTPSFAHKKRAGIVKIAPAASDSPADPMVWTMLLSSTESFLIIRRTAERKRKHSLLLEIGLVNTGETFGDDGLDYG